MARGLKKEDGKLIRLAVMFIFESPSRALGIQGSSFWCGMASKGKVQYYYTSLEGDHVVMMWGKNSPDLLLPYCAQNAQGVDDDGSCEEQQAQASKADIDDGFVIVFAGAISLHQGLVRPAHTPGVSQSLMPHFFCGNFWRILSSTRMLWRVAG